MSFRPRRRKSNLGTSSSDIALKVGETKTDKEIGLVR